MAYGALGSLPGGLQVRDALARAAPKRGAKRGTEQRVARRVVPSGPCGRCRARPSRIAGVAGRRARSAPHKAPVPQPNFLSTVR